MCTFNDQTIISPGFTDYSRDNVWSSCKNHSTPDQQREGGWFVNDALFFFKFFQDGKKTLFSPVAHNITSRYLKNKRRKKYHHHLHHTLTIFFYRCVLQGSNQVGKG